MDDLLHEFIAETRETLEALSGEIVAWEADPLDRARLDAIFRFVHTVKGSCGFLDLPRLARLSHAAEDVLAAVRAGERMPGTALVSAVLAIVDRIGELVEAIDSGASLDDTGEDLLIAALDGNTPLTAAASPVAGVAPTAVKTASRSVRLGVDLLDRMMLGMSDMVLARNELARALRARGADPGLELALERVSLTLTDMRETVTRTRMQRVESLFAALPRMVRDTSVGLGKLVALEIDGGDVELDREMIEVMRDPLVHMIRNAIDHGLEPPIERQRAGKGPAGRLSIAARQAGNQIVIEVSDDGRGIDTAKLVEKLAAQPGQDRATLLALPERAKLDLIFHPGLSSKDDATAVSGRGVGMDVVRANVEQIGGRIEVASARGRGATISIQVPLTLSIMPTVVVAVAGQRFAMPRQAIAEIVPAGSDSVRIDPLGDGFVVTTRQERMPLVDLGHVLGLGAAPHGRPMLVIVAMRHDRYALAVDQVDAIEELVVKPAAPAVMATGFYAGHTLPDTGVPMLLLDTAGIAAAAELALRSATDAAPAEPQLAEKPLAQALLFMDLDGERRAIPLAAVDRLDSVPVDSVRLSAGRLRMTADGALLPLVTRGEVSGRDSLAVLRLSDGEVAIGYAATAALDIVPLPAAITPASAPGAVAGVVMIEGEPVELVDAHWLFAQERRVVNARPALCLMQPDAGGWMEGFLRPVLEASGYRVVSELRIDEVADVALALDGAGAGASAPLVTLCREPGEADGARVYRYDREAVLAAVAARVRQGRAA